MSRGPFGFYKGMTLDDIPFRKEIISDGSAYLFFDAPKPHPLFSGYIVRISEKFGLSSVTVVSGDIETNSYGHSVEARFYDLQDRLSKVYGKCDLADYLEEDSIWDEPRDWMTALECGERTLMAVWDADSGSTLKDDIFQIVLEASADDENVGNVNLTYRFDNHNEARAAMNDAEDEVL